jgi:hypothetical protein
LRPGGAAGSLGVARQGDGALQVDYGVEGGTLWRAVAGESGEVLARQALLPGVAGAGWRFLADRRWTDRWPPEGATARIGAAPNPRAVELRLTLADGGLLRRVAVLPRDAP